MPETVRLVQVISTHTVSVNVPVSALYGNWKMIGVFHPTFFFFFVPSNRQWNIGNIKELKTTLLVPCTFALHMLKSHTLTRSLCRHSQTRYASVLANIPRPPAMHWTPPIVTPAEEPLTILSNNAFHPQVIPDRAKARINLDRINKMLDMAQKLVDQLQTQDQPQQWNLIENLETIVKEQKKLIKMLEVSKRSW